MSVKMYGPALDESGDIHESNVHEDNVPAFIKAGWVEGEKPKGAEQIEDIGKPLSKMNKTELLAEAAALGVETAEGATNREIVEAIEAATEAPENSDLGAEEVIPSNVSSTGGVTKINNGVQ